MTTITNNLVDTEIPITVADGGTGATTVRQAITTFAIPQCCAKNMILGGDFSTNPCTIEGNSGQTYNVSGNQTTSVADRWFWNNFGDGTISHNINKYDASSLRSTWGSFITPLVISVTGAATIAHDSGYSLQTTIEGSRWKLFAQTPLVLSFWVQTAIVGTYCVTLSNMAGGDPFARDIIFEYTINNADTWEYKEIKIPASPAAGTWRYGVGDPGLRIMFAFAGGSDYLWTGPIGEWVTGHTRVLNITNNQVNGMSGGNITIANIQIERGNIATGFEFRSPEYELYMCQRFRQKSWNSYPDNEPVGTHDMENISGGATGIFDVGGSPYGNIFIPFPTKMCFDPPGTVRIYDNAGNTGKALCYKSDYSARVSAVVDLIQADHNGLWIQGLDSYSFMELHYYVDNGVF